MSILNLALLQNVRASKDVIVFTPANLYGSGIVIGSNTTIGAFCEIGPDVYIGWNCRIQSGVFIPEGVKIGNSVFIGPHVVFTNVKNVHPRKAAERFGRILVGNDVVIGANSVILPDISIGEGAVIGAGSVVTKPVPAGWLVHGNPARQIRKVKHE